MCWPDAERGLRTVAAVRPRQSARSHTGCGSPPHRRRLRDAPRLHGPSAVGLRQAEFSSRSDLTRHRDRPDTLLRQNCRRPGDATKAHEVAAGLHEQQRAFSLSKCLFVIVVGYNRPRVQAVVPKCSQVRLTRLKHVNLAHAGRLLQIAPWALIDAKRHSQLVRLDLVKTLSPQGTRHDPGSPGSPSN